MFLHMSVESEVLFRPAGKLVMTGQLFCEAERYRTHRREVCFCGEAAVCLGRYMDRWASTCPPYPPPNLMACKGNTLHSFRYVSAFCHSLFRFQIHDVLMLITEKNDCRWDGRTSSVVLVTFTEGMCWNNDAKKKLASTKIRVISNFSFESNNSVREIWISHT
jgi:hypothetical protein